MSIAMREKLAAETTHAPGAYVEYVIGSLHPRLQEQFDVKGM